MVISIKLIKLDLRNRLKAVLPNNVKKIIRLFKNSSPYIVYKPKSKQLNISDYFLFLNGGYETTFVAENNLAIYLAARVECKHMFYFYNSDGIGCGYFEFVSDDFYYTLSITKEMTSGECVGGFIHQTNYSDEVLIQYKDDIADVVFQHRGYTGYRRVSDDSDVSSYVHGNFGAMYVNDNNELKSLARVYGKYCYTPQIILNCKNSYDFYFLNPTKNKMKIKIFIVDYDGHAETVGLKNLGRFSGYCFKLDYSMFKDDSNITWETNLPIGRSIIFEHNDSLINVFHS